MLYTSDEASDKYCPLRRNRDGGPAMCLGRDCMWWRFTKNGANRNGKGYCGMAGDPTPFLPPAPPAFGTIGAPREIDP